MCPDLTWSTIACKNAGTGAEPSPRAYHSATLLGKNLFVTGGQVHYWLLANNHYIHGAYILEIVKNQWEHNTIKGDSFIPCECRCRVLPDCYPMLPERYLVATR